MQKKLVLRAGVLSPTEDGLDKWPIFSGEEVVITNNYIVQDRNFKEKSKFEEPII